MLRHVLLIDQVLLVYMEILYEGIHTWSAVGGDPDCFHLVQKASKDQLTQPIHY